ncbi:MAG TPA: hypothetical protein VNJ06_12425 [Gemmatimonadales bacterium]|nr:hypothetical protein [Gemmatimonadales bacterium]
MAQVRILRSLLFSQALVLGALGGVALILVQVFSTRGPLIFIPYAAMFGALAPLLARYRNEGFLTRTGAGFAAFLMATVMAYAFIVLWANRGVPSMSLIGVARFATVLGSGAAIAAAVAFLVGDGQSERAV